MTGLAVGADGLGTGNQLGIVLATDWYLIRMGCEPLRESAAAANKDVEPTDGLIGVCSKEPLRLVRHRQWDFTLVGGEVDWHTLHDLIVSAQRTRALAHVFHAGGFTTAETRRKGVK